MPPGVAVVAMATGVALLEPDWRVAETPLADARAAPAAVNPYATSANHFGEPGGFRDGDVQASDRLPQAARWGHDPNVVPAAR
jgi:hypothetical protein